MLNDLLGWYKRNAKKFNDNEKRKALNELRQIQIILEKDLKTRGVM